MTASSLGRITSATTSTSDRWALWRGGEQNRDRKFLEQFGGAPFVTVLAAFALGYAAALLIHCAR